MLRSVLLSACALSVMTGCRRPDVAASAPATVSQIEESCWWSVDRSTVPADTVAERFRQVFIAIGFTSPTRAKLADTAWTHSGPAAIDPTRPDVGYEARVVAYQRGDSAHFRLFIGATSLPPSRGLPADALSGAVGIPLCARVAGAAAIPTVRLRKPTGEEGSPVWRSRRAKARS